MTYKSNSLWLVLTQEANYKNCLALLPIQFKPLTPLKLPNEEDKGIKIIYPIVFKTH